MNWDAIGAVSEALGSLAVVATLAYLVQQVRQNTLMMRRSEANATHAQNSAFRLAIMENTELARLMAEGARNPASLTPTEELRLRMTFHEFAWAV